VPLSGLQQQKLSHMFALLDLDGDGRLEQRDYVGRVEALARLRGWSRDSAVYQRNLGHALEEWENLCESADTNQDGRVTLDEFLRFGATYLDDRDAVRSWARGDVQLLFDAIDTDSDGRISIDEYRVYLEVYGADASAAETFFAHADLDEDGRITRAEMAHAFEEFFLSSDPAAAGNLLFGPLDAPGVDS
jgi:Ca2+-binding EF-hand superfamily protein